MGASHPCTCRIIKGGGDVSPPSSMYCLGPGAQVRLPVHRTASYVAHSTVESPRRSQSTRRKVVKQQGSEAYVVCIEISIPDIPKAVQHQIVRTRINGDCWNEASHTLNKSELGGGHIKTQSWNAHNCPYISAWLKTCHVTFRGEASI